MSNTRDNSGSFSANKRKEKDTHPDIKGQIVADGVEYWLDAWKKENERGIWYSVSLKRKDAQPQRQAQPAQRTTKDDFDDAIPF